MKRHLILLTILDVCLLFCYLIMGISREMGNAVASRSVYGEKGSENAERTGRAVHLDHADLADQPVRVALTFDDGPHPVYTKELLDGLKERGVRATFFVTGEHAKLHPDLILRMQEEGHLIGNHTYSHIQLRSDNQETFKKELLETNRVISEITGEEPLYVRPPYGSWDKKLEKELNMFPVLWTVDPTDWSCLNRDTVTQRVLSKVKNGSIILLHDYYNTSVEAALEIIDRLKEQGYTFVTVDELLLD